MSVFGNDTYSDSFKLEPYAVNKVQQGYTYYVQLLTEKCLGMYDYAGLPDSLPACQIELRLIQQGWCPIFYSNKLGKDHGLVTSYGGMSGIDEYYMPTNLIYAQPVLGSGNKTIHKDAVIIYNSQIDQYRRIGLWEIIRRYARMLADFDSSISIMTVNTRSMRMNVAANKVVAKTINDAMTKLAEGELQTINTNSILDLYKTLDWTTDRQQTIQDLLTAREQTLAAFLEEIGVKTATDKRERMITDEVYADDQLLTINVDDMLRYRQRGIAEVNKVFGTKISVKRAAAYKLKGDDQNASENISGK